MNRRFAKPVSPLAAAGQTHGPRCLADRRCRWSASMQSTPRSDSTAHRPNAGQAMTSSTAAADHKARPDRSPQPATFHAGLTGAGHNR